MDIKRLSRLTDDKNGLVVVLCLSAALKILVALFMRPFNSDGVLYITAAQFFAAGNFAEGVSLYPMPFYSMILCLAHFLVPHWEISAKLVSMASVIFATLPLYLITADFFNRRAAFWAALAFAVAPLPNDWAVDVVRGPLFLFFSLWAVFFAQRAFSHQGGRYFFLAAILSCLAVLVRIEGMVLLVFFLLFWIFTFSLEKQKRRALIKGLFCWMSVLLVFTGVCLWAVYCFGGSFNRFGEVLATLRGMANGDFLNSYHHIYEQLKGMEEFSAYSAGRQNFAEIARHFMALIYLIGLLEVFVVVLFPVFLLPLFLGFKRPIKNPQVFVLLLVSGYLLLIYVLFVERDFLQRRFLFTPAVLLYPWIGRGLEILRDRCSATNHARSCFIVFLVVFMALPVVKIIDSVAKDDNVLRHAGAWMAENPEAWRKGKVLTNDVMAPFFAGMHMGEYLVFDRCEKYDFPLMEKWALNHHVETLLIKIPNDRKSLLKDLSRYQPIKQIPGRKRSVYIYGIH